MHRLHAHMEANRSTLTLVSVTSHLLFKDRLSYGAWDSLGIDWVANCPKNLPASCPQDWGYKYPPLPLPVFSGSPGARTQVPRHMRLALHHLLSSGGLGVEWGYQKRCL